MKKNLFKLGMIAALSVAVVGIVSCGNKTEESTEISSVVAEQFVDHTVIPTYTNLASQAQLLVEKLQALKTSKTDANVEAACEVFLEARAWWEKSEAFLFGAASDFGIDPHIDSWPLDVDALTRLMNSPEMINALDSEDGDEVAGGELGDALLGFHGIEYILFRNGKARKADEITANEMIYAVAVAGDLRNRCFQLEVSWAGDNAPEAHAALMEELELNVTVGGGDLSYGENMKMAGRAGSIYASRVAALMAIVDGCKSIADEVGTQKIGRPHSGTTQEDRDYIESPYSQKSIIDFYNNIVSIYNSYMGGIEGERNDSKSLHNFVKEHDADLDARVLKTINDALELLDVNNGKLPVPFVDNFSNSAYDAAVDACTAIDDILSEVNNMLRGL